MDCGIGQFTARSRRQWPGLVATLNITILTDQISVSLHSARNRLQRTWRHTKTSQYLSSWLDHWVTSRPTSVDCVFSRAHWNLYTDHRRLRDGILLLELQFLWLADLSSQDWGPLHRHI